jgi:hypothetical protein
MTPFPTHAHSVVSTAERPTSGFLYPCTASPTALPPLKNFTWGTVSTAWAPASCHDVGTHRDGEGRAGQGETWWLGHGHQRGRVRDVVRVKHKRGRVFVCQPWATPTSRHGTRATPGRTHRRQIGASSVHLEHLDTGVLVAQLSNVGRQQSALAARLLGTQWQRTQGTSSVRTMPPRWRAHGKTCHPVVTPTQTHKR